MVFSRYAEFYDALYRDKDYPAECDLLESFFAKGGGNPVHEVLDLGCGTGGHALLLAQRGYAVTGIDRSEEMLDRAKEKARERGVSVVFQQHDLLTLQMGHTFDAVIAMFAAMGYQTSNEDVLAAFRTARQHLRAGGLFVFDAWFGPAVLAQLPSERMKVVEADGYRIIRFATPRLDIMTNTVEVKYSLTVLRSGRVLEEMEETHTMRFFFPQEVMNFLEMSGMHLLSMSPFMDSDQELTTEHWNFCVVARAV